MNVIKGSLTVDSTRFSPATCGCIVRLIFLISLTETRKVKFNFPLVPGILRDHRYLIAKKQPWNQVLKIPAVKGHFTEYEFCNGNDPIVLDVKFCNETTSTIVFTDYDVQRVDVVLSKMKLNTMYRLRYGHSVIDGVGLLSTGIVGEEWLVFV